MSAPPEPTPMLDLVPEIEERPIQRSTPPALVRGIAWVSLGAIALLLSMGGTPGGPRLGAQTFSALNLVFGLWVFWTHGRGRITAAGIWSISLGIFAGGGGLWAIPAGRQPGLVPALSIVYFGQVVTYFGFWARPAPMPPRVRLESSPAATSWGIWIGALLLTVSVLTTFAVEYASPSIQGDINLILGHSAFVGVVILAVSLFLHGRKGVGRWKPLVVGGAFLLYALLFWSGDGRLILVTLAICIAIPAGVRFRGRTMKAVILLGSVPILLILGWARLARSGEQPGGSFLSSAAIQVETNQGLGSVWEPVPNFGRLLVLEGQNHLPPTWGSTFMASALTVIPSRLFPGGRPGLFNGDSHLVPILAPDLVGTGFTTCALAHGEWLYNFGFAGLLLMLPVTGFGIRKLDDWLATVSSRPVWTRRHLLSLCAAICLAAGMADLAWGGSGTFVTRTIPRLALIGALFVFDTRASVARSIRYRNIVRTPATSDA